MFVKNKFKLVVTIRKGKIMADLTVLILAHNEEKNIERCIKEVKSIAKRIIVVDSGSTDRTVEIAGRMGAEVLYHPWKNRQIEARIRKLVEEYRGKGRNIAMTILRPTMIYGDLQDKNVSVFIKMVDKLRFFPTVNGARYDLQPVWCKDLGDAYYDVMQNWETTQNKEYILSGKEPIQLRRMFEVMAKQLGVKNVFISCPYPIAYAGACVIYFLTFKKIDYREKVQRLVEPRAYSHGKATKDFGYNPVSFEVGVQEEIKMYRNTVKEEIKNGL